MTEYQKLETLHCVLQDIEDDTSFLDSRIINDTLNHALTLVEEIREKYFDKDGKLIESRFE